MTQKKSSSVSAKQALEALLAIGYRTVKPDPGREIRPTERNAIRQNPGILVSKSGKSIHLVFTGDNSNLQHAPEIFVPAKGMLSFNEVKGLEMRAGIKLASD
jgi:hypothetical protein